MILQSETLWEDKRLTLRTFFKYYTLFRLKDFLMTTHSVSVKQRIAYGSSDLIMKAVFSIIFACLMAVSANTFIYLPFTPVPITLQVLTVIFSAMMLGGPWATASQAMYISMGIAGLPVFAGFAGGPSVLLGPTGGYIIGFSLAAFLTGSLMSEKSFNSLFRGNRYAVAVISGILGLLVIYLMGSLHLFGFLFGLSEKKQVLETARSVWIMGIRPFIILDLAKILTAILILRPGITSHEDNKNK